MDVMGDKATLLNMGRFVEPADREDTDTGTAEDEVRRLGVAGAGDAASMSVIGAELLRRGSRRRRTAAARRHRRG